MLHPLILITAMAWGQATQPAAAPARAPAAATRPAAVPATRPAAVPTTLPSAPKMVVRPTSQPFVIPSLPAPGPQPAAGTIAGMEGLDIGKLSGNPVDIEVTADGTIVLYGDEKDVMILQAFIAAMDNQPLFKPEFRIFQLQSGDAKDLAVKIQQFWDAAKKPATGQMRPEDRMTIIPEARSNILMVAAPAESMSQIEDIITKLDKPSIGGQVQFEQVLLKNIKATEAEATLKDLLKSLQERRGATRELVTIKAYPRLNMLLINAPEADLKQIRQWIDMIDVPPSAVAGSVVKMVIFPLMKAKASDLTKVLDGMLKADTDAAKAAAETIRRLQVVRKGPDGSETPLKDINLEKPIKLLAEDSSNVVIVATVEENIAPVGELIQLLDTVPLGAEILVKVFPLEHADVEAVATSLKDVFKQGQTLADQPGKPEVKGRIPQNIPGEALAYNIGFSGDKRTNTLVVSGRAEQLLIVTQIIKAMDGETSFGKYAPKMVKLEHAGVKSIADVVTKIADQRQSVLKQSVTAAVAERDKAVIIPDVRTNCLIIVATDEDLKELSKLAKDLDGAEDEWLGQIRIVNLVADLPATEIADRIKELWDRRAALRKEGGLPEDKPVVIADTRSNSLVVASSKDDYDAIEGLVKKLAAQKVAPMADIRLLAMKHNDVSKVAEIVRKLFDERLKISKTEGQKDQPSDRIAVVEDPLTRTMLVASSKANYDEVVKLVEKLDVPPTAEGVYKTFFVQYADPENAAKFLQDFFKQGLYIGTADTKTLPEGLMKVTVVSDARTKAVILSASPQNLAIAESLLGQIDRKEVPTLFAPHIVKLEHADAKTIGDVVQKLIDQQNKIIEQTASKAAAEREKTLAFPDVRTNSLIIVAKDDVYESLSELVKRLDGAEEDWLGQIHIINMKNLTASDLASKIEDLWKRRADQRKKGGLPEDMPVIVADTRSNALVVASSTADFESIMGLVNKLEAQRLSPMAEIRLLTLKNNDATKVADIIKKLFDERTKNNLAEGQKEQPSDRIAITDDPLTRTILIASSKSNFEEIEQLVAKLDVAPVTEGLFRIFPVRNADISKAEKLVKDLFDKGLYQGSSDKKNLPEWASKVTIVSDLRSSSLIASGSPQNMQIVEALLKEVDREDVPNLPAGAVFIPIQHADVVNVADLMEKMFEGMKASMSSDQKDQLEAKILPDTRNRALIVAGTKLALKRAEELVAKLDQETMGAAYSVEVYKLKEAAASKLEPVMTEMFEKRMSQDQAGKRTPIHIVGDDGSNSLIVTASADDHKMAKDLVEKLDRKSTLAEQLHVIPLAKAQADQVSEMLQKLIEKQQAGDKKAGGFAVTPEPRTNSLLVWAGPDMLNQIKTIVETLDNNRPKTDMALRVFTLKNAKAEDLGKLLDDFFDKAGAGKKDKEARQMFIKFTSTDSQTGQPVEQTLVHQDLTITPDKNTNSLMVLAPEKNINMVEMMVKMLDSVEPQTADIRVFPLRNADATEMKKLLEDLLGAGKGGGKEEERKQFVLAGGEGGATVVAGGGSSMQVAFSVDERTNALIAAGNSSYLKVIEGLVMKLDYMEFPDRVQSVVQLKARPAQDIAKTMKAYYTEESAIYEKAGEGEAKILKSKRQVNVQDGGEGSNTLVVSYSPLMESQVVNMINELDRPPAMVMIQVLIAEVTLDNTFELGLEFALQDLVFSENASTGPNGTLQGSGFDVIGGTDLGASGTGGGISLTVTGEDFNFLVKAMQVEGRLEILSRPSLLVQDNQEAVINIGQKVPTVQDIVVSGSGIVTPSVTYEKVGVEMKVTPIINPDGFVSMKIEPSISAIATSSVTISSGVTLPIFTNRSAKTAVRVKDNETIVIGGLIISTDNSSENKVPLAGDVPILGNLFRATRRQSSKTELLMVLTPHVIQTPEEARTLAVQMRDQTGLLDNVRHSPLMQQLQVQPEEDQFGPDAVLRPTGEKKPRAEGGEMLGPDVEPLGPPVSSPTTRPANESKVVTVETK